MKDGVFKPIDYYECWWGFGHMPNLNFDYLTLYNFEKTIDEMN